MIKIGKIEIEKGVLLAPMEDVTNRAFRKICKEFGADIVYTEFINSDGLSRKNEKTIRKSFITEEERPVGIQIYGGNLEPMVTAAKMVEEFNPDIIDINAGCWVRKVAGRGAGAGLLKDPPYLQKLVAEVVKAVNVPVTVKTRIGWDENSIHIVEIAKRLEDVGIAALTIHCRTRQQGHSGEVAWEWIDKVKEVVRIPVILNGGIMEAKDGLRAFQETNADGIMIARGAIGYPWIFREIKELLQYGEIKTPLSPKERILTALKHLRYEIEIATEERYAVVPFRKFYSGYLKGLYNSSKIRQKLMEFTEYEPVEETLLSYLEILENRDSELDEKHIKSETE